MSLLEREVRGDVVDFDALNAAHFRYMAIRDGLVPLDASEEIVSERPMRFFSEKSSAQLSSAYLGSRDRHGNRPLDHDFLTIFNSEISPKTRCLVHFGDNEDIYFAVKFLSISERCFVSEELMLLPSTPFYEERRKRIRSKLLSVNSPSLSAAIEKHKAIEAVR